MKISLVTENSFCKIEFAIKIFILCIKYLKNFFYLCRCRECFVREVGYGV